MSKEGQFPIQITGDASSLVEASQQTNQALESNRLKLSELTPEQKAQAQSLDLTKTATQEAGAAAGEHAGKLQFLGLKTGELRKLTRELSTEFPIAGMAARLMINPIVAGLTIAIMTFGAAKKALDDWNAKLDATAAQNASHDFFPGIQAQKESLDQAKTSAAEFATALGNIGAAEDKFKTKVSEAIDKLREFTNAQAEVNSAGEAKELAEVDLKQKTGKLDEVGGIKARAEIQERYRKQQDALKTQGEQDEVKLLETELQHDKDSQTSLSQAAADARKKRDTLKARRAQAEKDLEEGKKKAAEYDTAADEAIAANDESGPSAGLVQSGEVPGDLAIDATPEGLKDALRQRDAQRRFNKSNEELIRRLDQGELPQAEGAVSGADTRAKSNAERVNELERTVPAKKAVLGIREQGRAVAGGLKDQTTETETAAQIAAKLAEVQKELVALKAEIVKTALSGHGVNTAALDALKALEGHNKALAKELAEQEKRIRAMEGRPPRV